MAGKPRLKAVSSMKILFLMELYHFKQPIEAKLKHTWAERSSLDGERLLLRDDLMSLCCLVLPCTPGRYLCRKLATLPKSSLRTNLLNQQSLACHGYHGGSTPQVSFPARGSSQHGSNHRPRISGEGTWMSTVTMIIKIELRRSSNLWLMQCSASSFMK